MKRHDVAYAGIGERFLAYLLDSVVLVIIGAILQALLAQHAISIIFNFAAAAAYFVYSTASVWQATPAQRLMGIHLIRTDGRPLTRTHAFERFLALTLPGLPMHSSFIPPDVMPNLVLLLTLAWFAPILYTRERTGLHDMMCGTRVVKGNTRA
jgi:uncharacterized RDD family membrane protein YckC